MLELSATPNTGGTHQSNVLVNVPSNDLKEEKERLSIGNRSFREPTF